MRPKKTESQITQLQQFFAKLKISRCVNLIKNDGAAAIRPTALELRESEDASAQIKIVGSRYTVQKKKATEL